MNISRSEPTTKFISCSCHSEGLHIASFPAESQVYISMYYIGKGHRLTWWERIKYCWHVLYKGEQYLDQLILDKQGVADLVDHLIDLQNKK